MLIFSYKVYKSYTDWAACDLINKNEGVSDCVFIDGKWFQLLLKPFMKLKLYVPSADRIGLILRVALLVLGRQYRIIQMGIRGQNSLGKPYKNRQKALAHYFPFEFYSRYFSSPLPRSNVDLESDDFQETAVRDPQSQH